MKCILLKKVYQKFWLEDHIRSVYDYASKLIYEEYKCKGYHVIKWNIYENEEDYILLAMIRSGE